MASTRNLQASAAWVLPILNYQPINISGDEPALSAANMTKQVMLGAPFKHRWNRAETNIALIPASQTTPPVTAKQDYMVALSDFGFIERATVTDGTGKVNELLIKQSLPLESAVQRPGSVAIQADDNAGNLTVRVNALPDRAYNLTLTYQRKSVPITSMAATWAPIPDELGYVFDWGFLAHCCLLLKDARFPIFFQKFTAHLLGAVEGLDELDRNIFLGNWLQVLTAPQKAQGVTQQGMSGRQV